MSPKPYAASHLGSVASAYTDLRLSGEVKEALVERTLRELDLLVPQMERSTLELDPERKTLGDVDRTRLNYNRTRELMLDRLTDLESVSSAAVVTAIDHLERMIAGLISVASDAAESERMSTIKSRHLPEASRVQEAGSTTVPTPEPSLEDPLEQSLEASNVGVLTAQSVRRLARTFAGMHVSDEAIEELILQYYDHIDTVQSSLTSSGMLGKDPTQFIRDLSRMRELMALGWMRGMLGTAAGHAKDQGATRIEIEHVVHIDAFLG